jgi:Fic family protein
MYPPYLITTKILRQIASISEKIGQINARLLDKPSPKLRKENRIKTIYSTLQIEGNKLTEEQITAIIDNQRIIGPKTDILEVKNAIELYKKLDSFNPFSVNSFLNAHKILMKDLVNDNGRYRKQGVGVISGDQIRNLAPPSENVPYLMKDLFAFLKKSDELVLIKSCVFHYEMEFIHPFTDGNGRMGRLWQILILMKEYPVFEFIPFENLIHKNQAKYYDALSLSDKTGNSTHFIEYMLGVVDDSLVNLLDIRNRVMSSEDRLKYFFEKVKNPFSRKDYMSLFPDISTATASRDLKLGIQLGYLNKIGDKATAIYQKKIIT